LAISSLAATPATGHAGSELDDTSTFRQVGGLDGAGEGHRVGSRRRGRARPRGRPRGTCPPGPRPCPPATDPTFPAPATEHPRRWSRSGSSGGRNGTGGRRGPEESGPQSEKPPGPEGPSDSLISDRRPPVRIVSNPAVGLGVGSCLAPTYRAPIRTGLTSDQKPDDQPQSGRDEGEDQMEQVRRRRRLEEPLLAAGPAILALLLHPRHRPLLSTSLSCSHPNSCTCPPTPR
jgi:hypothetical protein